MENNSIKAYRVEVLGDNVQKYASSAISGGGGYITTVNGRTYGQTQGITTEVTHHVDQDIWVKDIASGKEMQLNIVGTTLPVRPGHVLRVAFDEKTKLWERLINETIGVSDYGNGKVNPIVAQEMIKRSYIVIIGMAIGLIIPMINMFVGLVVLIILWGSVPSNLYGTKIPKALQRISVATLAGTCLFLFPYFCMWIFSNGESYFLKKLFVFMVLIPCLIYFVKPCLDMYQDAANMVKKRSNLLDKSVERSAFL